MPKLTKLATKKGAPVVVRLTARERERWHAAARVLDMNMAELVREAVRGRVAQVVPVSRGQTT